MALWADENRKFGGGSNSSLYGPAFHMAKFPLPEAKSSLTLGTHPVRIAGIEKGQRKRGKSRNRAKEREHALSSRSVS